MRGGCDQRGMNADSCSRAKRKLLPVVKEETSVDFLLVGIFSCM